ncbi:MAG: hypothetical protein M9962_10155 [Oligoflexia bacterium]|nr:hypothetical protein [Oligoflexia bacterium]
MRTLLILTILLNSTLLFANTEGEKFALPSKAVDQNLKIEKENQPREIVIQPPIIETATTTWAREKMSSLLSNDKFIVALGELREKAKSKTFLWIEIGFFLLMILFRTWRQSKSRNWFTRYSVGLVLTLFIWSGVLFLIPALWIGEPFHIVLGTIFQVISI